MAVSLKRQTTNSLFPNSFTENHVEPTRKIVVQWQANHTIYKHDGLIPQGIRYWQTTRVQVNEACWCTLWQWKWNRCAWHSLTGVLGLDNLDFAASTLDLARSQGSMSSASGSPADDAKPSAGVNTRLKINSLTGPKLHQLQQQQLNGQLTLNLSQHDLRKMMEIINAGKRRRKRRRYNWTTTDCCPDVAEANLNLVMADVRVSLCVDKMYVSLKVWSFFHTQFRLTQLYTHTRTYAHTHRVFVKTKKTNDMIGIKMKDGCMCLTFRIQWAMKTVLNFSHVDIKVRCFCRQFNW
jgi:hypothetical protein